MWYCMLKDSMSILVILCLTVVMILSVASTAQKNMNITGNDINASNTLLNNTLLSNIIANNTSLNPIFNNGATNVYAYNMGNGTKMGQAIDRTGHAKYTNNLGSLAKNETNKPGKDLEKVVFICNIV